MSDIANPKIQIEDVTYTYEGQEALRHISLGVPANAVTAFLGPAGSGKSTMLRLINRLNDLIDGTSMTGRILIDGEDVYSRDVDVAGLRRRVGMVFALPLPLPLTVRENILYGPKLAGMRDRTKLEEILVRSLSQAALWDEVKDRLDNPAGALSGGQQQRLCIARALAVRPDVILMDEPCSALDPIATLKIEDLMRELAQSYTIVIVTHNMQQAARVADYTAFLMMRPDRSGELVEYRSTDEIFTAPKDKRTEDYITGRFG